MLELRGQVLEQTETYHYAIFCSMLLDNTTSHADGQEPRRWKVFVIDQPYFISDFHDSPKRVVGCQSRKG